MKIHDQIEDLMAAALYDGLSTEERKAFEQHLAECSECRILYKEEQMVSQMIEKTLSVDRPAKDFEQRMVKGFREELSKPKSSAFKTFGSLRNLFQLRYATPLAALAIVLVMVQLGSYLSNDSRDHRLEGFFDSVLGGEEKSLQRNQFVAKSAFMNLDQEQMAVGSGVALEEGSYNEPAASRGIDLQVSPPMPAAKVLIANDKSEMNVNALPLTVLKQQEKFDNELDSNKKLMRAANAKEFQNGGIVGANGVPAATGKGKALLEKDFKENAPSSLPAQEEPAVTERKLIRNAHMDLEVSSFESASQQITEIARESKGFVSTTSNAQLANGRKRGTIVVKVQPDNLDSFLLKIQKIGEVKNQSIGAQDVTKDYFDTQARLRNAQRMEERLLELLKDAKGKVNEILQVEKELGRVREQIEQMQGSLKLYDSLVQYATVTIQLYEKDLDQAAAFLLKEQAVLSLSTPDVESTFKKAKQDAEEFKAQILHSDLNRNASGRMSAVLDVLVAPETSEALIARFKLMGHVNEFNVQSQRIPQNGNNRAEGVKDKKDKVEIHLTIVHDDESRKQVNLSIVNKQVEEVFEKAKTESIAQGCEIISSGLQKGNNSVTTAQIQIRVPGKSYTSTLNALKGLGRVAQLTIQRNDQNADGKSLEESPAILTLTLTSEEAPIQQTQLSLLVKDVENKMISLKALAAQNNAEVRQSNFQRDTDGGELGNLTLRIVMKKNAAFLENIKALGKVKNLTVQRQDRVQEGADMENAVAEISIQIYSQGDIVADDSGIWSTLRKTASKGFASLMWSLEMIGVALAFLAPWLLLGGIVGWIGLRIYRKKKATDERK